MVGDIFDNVYSLLDREVLDNVFVRDSRRVKEIPFVYNGVRYKRQYEWVFRGDVAKILIGEKRKCGIVGAMVYINYSRLRYEPYVAIVNHSDVFESIDVVAEMVARALTWVYEGHGIALYLEPWISKEEEPVQWGRDCNEAHTLAATKGTLQVDEEWDLKTCVNQIIKTHTKKLDVSPPKKENAKEKNFVSALNDKKKLEKVKALINELMEGATETRDIIRPFCAAIVSGVMRRATWAEVKESFNLEEKLRSSYYRLTTDSSSYNCPAFDEIVARFKAL